MAITDAPELFFDIKQPSSIQRTTIAAATLKQVTSPPNLWLVQFDPSFIPGDHSSVTLRGIQREYDFQHRLDVWAGGMLDDAGFAAKTAAFMAQFIPAASLPTKMGLALGRLRADKGVTAALDHLKEHGFAETSAWLNQRLLQLRDEGQLGDLSDVQTFSPQERLQFLKQSKIIDDLLDAAVSEKDKPLMREMALRVLDDRLKKSIEIEGQYDAAKNEELAGQVRQIAAVSASLRTFMDDTHDELASLHQTQADLQDQVDQLVGRVDKNASDIQFLQSFMFDKMSPEEQIGALKSGFFANMPAADREKLEIKITLVEGRQKLLAAVGAYAEGAATVARIASRVGVDPTVVGMIQKTAQLASVACAVATGFMTGGLGYLAAADAVTGLIFGSGSDAGAERQQQIMQALAQISGQLDEIRDMIVEVQKGINIIIDNQRQLFDGIVSLSKQIDKDYQETMAELSLIRQDLNAIKSIANEILDTNIGACPIFQDRLVSDGFSSLTPIPFTTLCNNFIEYGAKGLEGLKDRLRNPLETGGYHLARFADPGSPSDRLITMYKRLYDIAARYVLTANLDAHLYAFATPVTTIAAVDAKRERVLARAKPANDLFYRPRSWAARATALPEPLSADAIELHLDFLMFCHPFFEMRDELSGRDLEGFLSLKGSSDEGRYLLETGLDLARMALIQQTILSGDVLLGDFDTFWRDGFDGPTPRVGETAAQSQSRAAPWMELVAILPEQTVLRQNLILYAVSKVIAQTSSLLAYSVAYTVERDPAYLYKVLPPERFALVWVDAAGAAPPAAAGWNVKLGEQHFPLPTPDETLAGRIVTSPYSELLVKVLGRLSGELSGHVVAGRLTADQQRDFRRAAWGAAEARKPKALPLSREI